MKRTLRFAALALAFLMAFATVSGCAVETVEIISPSTLTPPDDGEMYVELPMQMVPLTESPAMFGTTSMPTAPGTKVKENNKAVIDYSNSRDGYVMAKYKATTTKELRVLVTGPSGTQYQYTLKQDKTYEVYPLSDGSGKYNIGVYEQVDGSKYAVAVSGQIDVSLTDEFAPFLRPNQYVNFTPESKVVAKAEELISGKTVLTEKIAAIYSFVVTNLKYDRERAATVKSGYLPDVDDVLAQGKGICFDYAAVMASMLRSQGIPTKLVVGYAGDAYHAWIDVYSETEGWINAVIFFDGKEWKLMDPTFASSGGQSSAVMQYIGDGKNYTVKYLY